MQEKHLYAILSLEVLEKIDEVNKKEYTKNIKPNFEEGLLENGGKKIKL